ncbi:hypothetical protein CEP54_006759 [Fusarium duplospermum]|uniref:Uncharacterized protein n=1 Tax=Fusarium duplospermum TaxID=1325734 RepID=A0A428Q592_9HYPO|nr:hypothetical protein CEP54_006759 [Fusarium duplospermum]
MFRVIGIMFCLYLALRYLLGVIRFTFRFLYAVWCSTRPYILSTIIILFLPIFTGFVDGVLVSTDFADWGNQLLVLFEKNVQDAREFQASSARDIGLPPYHVPWLLDPTDWWIQLGIMEQRDSYDLGSLNVLYQKTNQTTQGKPWHHWVYASNNPFQDTDVFLDEWDKAFDQLVQHRYVSPSIESAGFHYIACPSNFLCTSWHIEGPAFVHFTTAPEEQPKSPKVPGYEAVTVRIINLPLKTPVDNPRIFPSHFNQMRAITDNTSLWATFPTYDEKTYMLQTLSKRREISLNSYPWTYGTLVTLTRWVTKLYTAEYSEYLEKIQVLVTFVTSVVSLGVRMYWNHFTQSSGGKPNEEP